MPDGLLVRSFWIGVGSASLLLAGACAGERRFFTADEVRARLAAREIDVGVASSQSSSNYTTLVPTARTRARFGEFHLLVLPEDPDVRTSEWEDGLSTPTNEYVERTGGELHVLERYWNVVLEWNGTEGEKRAKHSRLDAALEALDATEK